MKSSDELASFTSPYQREIEAELRDGPPAPDLAEVFARASQIDHDAIPKGLHARVELAGEGRDQDLDLAELQSFTAALRQEVETDVEQRTMSPTSVHDGGTVPWVQIFGIAAALLLGLVALTRLIPAIAELDEAPDPVVEPLSLELPDSTFPVETHEALPPPPRPRRAVPRPEEGVELEPPPEPAPAAAPPQKRHRATLDQLEHEANTLWTAGDLERTESLLRRIIARAGQSARAELAYGDLFALARQRRGPAAQAKVWREYLRRFPEGRYADDAQAGLCLRSLEDRRAECWRAYLRTHPDGTHVVQARRTLEREP